MLTDKHLKYDVDKAEANQEEREEQDDPRALRQIASDPQLVDAGLEFEFFVGPWSSCSQTCGLNGSGYRVSFLKDFY